MIFAYGAAVNAVCRELSIVLIDDFFKKELKQNGE
jgi:hypothetical protein